MYDKLPLVLFFVKVSKCIFVPLFATNFSIFVSFRLMPVLVALINYCMQQMQPLFLPSGIHINEINDSPSLHTLHQLKVILLETYCKLLFV